MRFTRDSSLAAAKVSQRINSTQLAQASGSNIKSKGREDGRVLCFSTDCPFQYLLLRNFSSGSCVLLSCYVIHAVAVVYLIKLVRCEIGLHKKMSESIFLVCLISVALLLFVSKGDAHRQGGICSWTSYEYSKCSRSDFPCVDGTCIDRKSYCNGISDCEDNSDEEFCGPNDPLDSEVPLLTYHSAKSKCPMSDNFIPNEWFCDGVEDCYAGADELCGEAKVNAHAVKIKAIEWLTAQKNSGSVANMWGSSVDKSAVALYLGNNKWSQENPETRKEMLYELSIQLLSRLSKEKLKDVPSDELASYINAFLVTCLDPRKFHGLDLVRELRSRVDNQNFTNPYLLLSLCNAGDTITESDRLKLIGAFSNKRRTFWTGIRAIAIMALACANKQTENDKDSKKLKELVVVLKDDQRKNGMVENLQTTALVMQALLSAEPDSDTDLFDEEKVLKAILPMQELDGSFGSFVDTFFILPILNCQSLVNISSDHCEPASQEIATYEHLTKLGGPKIRILYSLWIGNENDLERNQVLRVPANITFFRVMEIAADLDSRYRFDFSILNGKTYITAISGLQEDPLQSKFWFLYKLDKGKLKKTKESPGDVIPNDNEHYVMWYKKGTWVDDDSVKPKADRSKNN